MAMGRPGSISMAMELSKRGITIWVKIWGDNCKFFIFYFCLRKKERRIQLKHALYQFSNVSYSKSTFSYKDNISHIQPTLFFQFLLFIFCSFKLRKQIIWSSTPMILAGYVAAFSSKVECDERPFNLKDISCKLQVGRVGSQHAPASWFARRKPTHAESSSGSTDTYLNPILHA